MHDLPDDCPDLPWGDFVAACDEMLGGQTRLTWGRAESAFKTFMYQEVVDGRRVCIYTSPPDPNGRATACYRTPGGLSRRHAVMVR